MVAVDALKFACPHCRSSVGEQCTRPSWLGQPRAVCKTPHPSRVRKAALAAGLSVEEAEAVVDASMGEKIAKYRELFPSSLNEVVEGNQP